MEYKDICQIILNISFISVFIGVFFFTYASKVEQDILKDQTNYIAKHIADDFKLFVSNETKQGIKANIKSVNMDEEDKEVKEANSKLAKKALILLGVFFLMGLITAFTIIKWKNIKTNIFLQAMVILLFVAITEFAFLNLVARNYRIADVNYVKKQFLIAVKESIAD